MRPFNHTGPGQRPVFVVPALAERVAQAARSGAGTVRVGGQADVGHPLHLGVHGAVGVGAAVGGLAPLGGPEQLGGVAGQEGLKAGTRGFERRRSRRFQAVKHHPQPSGGVGVARKEQLLYAAPLLRAFERQVRQQHQWPGLLTRRSLQMQPPSVCSMLYMILTGPSGWLGRGRQNRAQAALVQRRPDLPPQPRQVHAAVTLWQRAEMNQRLVVIPVCERAVIPPLVQRSSQQNQALHEMAFIALNTSPDAFPGFVGLPPLARSEQFSAAH